MMFFKSIEEFKLFVSVSGSLKFDSIAPSIKQVTRKRLLPVLGKNLLDEILGFYTNGDKDDDTNKEKVELLELIQEAVANFAIELFIPQANAHVSDHGISVQENEHSKPAEWWRIKDLVRKHAQAGEEALEEAVLFLEKSGNFNSWNSSDQKKELEKLLLRSLDSFKDHYALLAGGYLTYLVLKPHIQNAQGLYLEPTLGKDVLQSFLDYTGTDDKILEAIGIAQKACAFISLGLASKSNLFEVTPLGFRKRLTTTSNTFIDKTTEASQNELFHFKEEAFKLGNAYLQKLTDYLNENASSTLFTEWFDSDLYQDPANTTGRPVVRGEGGIISF